MSLHIPTLLSYLLNTSTKYAIIIKILLSVLYYILISILSVNLDSKLKRHVSRTDPDAPNFSRDIRASCETEHK